MCTETISSTIKICCIRRPFEKPQSVQLIVNEDIIINKNRRFSLIVFTVIQRYK